MRMLPFIKRKKGVQFAGIGFDSSGEGGGGGGGGGGSSGIELPLDNSEKVIGKVGEDPLYCGVYVKTSGSGNYHEISVPNIKNLYSDTETLYYASGMSEGFDVMGVTGLKYYDNAFHINLSNNITLTPAHPLRLIVTYTKN